MPIDRLNKASLERLFTAVLSLETKEECHQFFDDLCTVGEVESLVQRLEVARMLQEGFTYQDIETETGASTATISRVKRCFHDGHGGYRLVIDRM